MAYIPISKLLRDKTSLYKLVMAASKRATELAQGAAPLTETVSKKITTIALEEIAAGKVTYSIEAVKPAKEKASEKEAGE
ncbi:MAG: DNA-directed RNA polymerase subunit omega [Candidatus Omnitrophica bacterium]|nr:DNA-directed RNA polymerase subunit omega [Candidatus Omnitrophota bacterium]